MASSPTHFYRLEISAGHTGGAFRYCSEIAGTLGEIKEAIVGEAGNAQGLSFLLGEDCTFELELHEDGKKLGAWNLYPALTLRLPRGKTLAFLPSGAIEGVLEEDPGMLFEDPVIGPILAGEVEPTPVVDFTVLHLPTPRDKPLARGSEATSSATADPRRRPTVDTTIGTTAHTARA